MTTSHPYRPTQAKILKQVRQSRANGYTYLSNPKVASSTIRMNLWQHSFDRKEVDHLPRNIGELHRQGIWDEGFDEIDHNTFVFSFVRNPFTRILSCYKDKIAGSSFMRSCLLARHNIPRETQVSFIEFLKLISTEPAETDDHHCRPQWRNLFVGMVPINFVGHFEHFNEHFRHVVETLRLPATIQETRPHRTDALQSLRTHFTTEAVDLVLKKYGEDFDLFGYAKDPGIVAPLEARPKTFNAITDRIGSIYVNCVGQLRRNPSGVSAHLSELRNAGSLVAPMYETLYDALRATGRNGEAMKIADECAAKFENHETSLLLRARNQTAAGNLDAAARTTGLLTAKQPGYAPYIRLNVHALIAAGHYREAIAAGRWSVDFAPADVTNSLSLASALLAIGNRQEARRALDQAEVLNASKKQKRELETLRRKASLRTRSGLTNWVKTFGRSHHGDIQA